MSFTNLQPSSVNTLATFTFANVSVTNTSTLGDVGNVKITGGSTGQAIITDGTGNLSFTSVTTTPPGSNTQVAYNNAGSYGASANFTFTNTTNTLTVDKIIANGAGLTSLTGANVTGTVSTAATVTTNAQPNITSTGTLTGVTVSGVTNLGAVTNVKITGGLTNQVLTTDGLGNLTWAAGGGGGGSSGGAGFITVTKDVFTATGSANAYTLSITPASAAYVVVNIDGIVQQLSSYSLATNILTIAGMPTSGEVVEITSYGVGGLPGGSDTEVQYNSSGVFQGAPAFTFNSSTGTVSATNFTGNLTTGAQSNITSTGTLTSLSVSGTANLTGGAVFASSQDVTVSGTPSGTVNYDLFSGAIFDVTPTANWTANVGNIATTNNRTTVVSFIINQGSTPYVPTVFQISGSTTTVNWLGGSAPTGTASKIDVVSYSMIRTGSGTWTVLGQIATYG